MSGKRLIIFTDLDGTLLDARTYSFAAAEGALRLLDELGVPVVICTSKTRAEILHYREKLNNAHPFISENGGGIFIPKGYFGSPVAGRDMGGFTAIEPGTPYGRLREALLALRAGGFDVKGFGDMTAEEVSGLTGVPMDEAVMAKAREYDEPFVFNGPGAELPRLQDEIRRMGLSFTKGRLMHILGGNDKGRAVRLLADIYRGEYGDITTCALGDSPNDAPMLAAVDRAFLVRKPEGFHDPDIAGTDAEKVDGVGPEGWSEAVRRLLREMGMA